MRGKRWEGSCPDHVYSNFDHNDVETCIIKSNISDHFSTICKIRNVKRVDQSKIEIYKRKTSLNESEKASFLNELSSRLSNLNSNPTVSCVHSKTKFIIEVFQELINKYMPLKKLTRKQKSFYLKPWITPAIQTSIKKKR